jgi:hypothetical protein
MKGGDEGRWRVGVHHARLEQLRERAAQPEQQVRCMHIGEAMGDGGEITCLGERAAQPEQE